MLTTMFAVHSSYVRTANESAVANMAAYISSVIDSIANDVSGSVVVLSLRAAMSDICSESDMLRCEQKLKVKIYSDLVYVQHGKITAASPIYSEIHLWKHDGRAYSSVQFRAMDANNTVVVKGYYDVITIEKAKITIDNISSERLFVY